MNPPGGWHPLKLSGCILWLRASLGVSTTGSTVTAVADQSGRGNNVVAVGSPSLVSNAINGRPGFSFASGAYLRSTTNRLFVRNAARHIFAVCRTVSGSGTFSAGGGIILQTPYTTSGTTGQTNCFALGRAAKTYGYFSGTAQGYGYTGAALDGTNHVVDLAEQDGTGLHLNTFKDNGVYNTLDTPGSTPDQKDAEADAVGFTVGCPAWSNSYFFSGPVCELLAFNRILPTLEAAAVRRYFANMYAITITD